MSKGKKEETEQEKIERMAAEADAAGCMIVSAPVHSGSGK